MAASKKAQEMSRSYISHKIMDKLNETESAKYEIAMKAGYTFDYAYHRDVEKSKTFLELSNDITNKVGGNLLKYIDAIDEDVKNGAIDNLTLSDKLNHAKILASLLKTLAPTFKQKKTSKESDGTYSTVWTTLN